MAETISTGQIKDLESMRPQYEAEKKRGATTDSFEVWSLLLVELKVKVLSIGQKLICKVLKMNINE